MSSHPVEMLGGYFQPKGGDEYRIQRTLLSV